MDKKHNNQQETTLTRSSANQIDKIKSIVGKNNTIAAILNDTEPSLAGIRREYGETNTHIIVAMAITDLSNLTDAGFNDGQFQYLIEYIMTEFYFLTVSDFNAMRKQFVESKFYGKPTINDFVHIINEYASTRMNAAESLSVKRDIEKFKNENNNHVTNEKIREYYDKLKSGWKPETIEKDKTEREKMREAQVRYLRDQKDV